MRTSTEYRRPYRPLAVSLVNRVGRAARRFGFGGARDVGRMVAAARRRTGLSDFGDEWFLEPLEVLVESINAEARLTPLGATIQRARIVSALAIRLRAARLLREHPEILDVDLGRILLIAGLQRTATTTLHRLLAADPGVRALRAWEVLSPVPLGDEGTGAPRRRMRQAKRAARAIGFLAPDFRAVHPMAWDAPEEDVLLLDLSFMSQAPEAAMHVPSYSRWLEARDHTKCYEYLLTVLKILHWQRPGDCWVLKTPHHMEHLDVILDVFPDVCVIQTHRDPKKAVPSFCSMVAHGRGIFSDRVDPPEIGAHWMRKIRRMMERSMSVRRGAAEHVFVDVSFYDLIADPVGELRRMYGAAGIDFTDEAADAARNVSERSGKDGHGRHVYSPASFGLDEETIDRHSAAYRREYRIPDEVVT
ncbi:MAG: sulfotransferase [Gemmatimonadales bacterium]|nr:sulfotransferase [Gemmatimonadales bacterium]